MIFVTAYSKFSLKLTCYTIKIQFEVNTAALFVLAYNLENYVDIDPLHLDILVQQDINVIR